MWKKFYIELEGKSPPRVLTEMEIFTIIRLSSGSKWSKRDENVGPSGPKRSKIVPNPDLRLKNKALAIAGEVYLLP